jgi:hypothetical protein
VSSPIPFAAACGGQSVVVDHGSPSPALDPSFEACPPIEVLATLEPGRLYNHNPFAVGPDGTVYVARPSGMSQGSNSILLLGSDIASIPPGGGPMTQVPGTSGRQPVVMQVVGETLYFQERAALYSIPTSGGTPSLISELTIPGVSLEYGSSLGTYSEFDSSNLLVQSCLPGPTPNSWVAIWSLPMDGSAVLQLLPSTEGGGDCNSPMATDLESVFFYFTSTRTTGIYQVPKTRGHATLVRQSNRSQGVFGVVSQTLYTTMFTDSNTEEFDRFALDPNASPQVIPMVDGSSAQAMAFATTDDRRSGYVALGISRGLQGPNWIAIAPLPTGNEHVKAIGCGPPIPSPSDAAARSGPNSIDSMALDPEYVYAIGSTGYPGPSGGAVFRIHR